MKLMYGCLNLNHDLYMQYDAENYRTQFEAQWFLCNLKMFYIKMIDCGESLHSLLCTHPVSFMKAD